MLFAKQKKYIIILICSLIALTGCTNNAPVRMKVVKRINSNDSYDREAKRWARGVEETESKFSGAAFQRQSFKSSFGQIQPQDSIGQLKSAELLVRQRGDKSTNLIDAEIRGGSLLRLREQKGNWIEFRSSNIDGKGFGSGTDESRRRWDFLGYRKSLNNSE